MKLAFGDLEANGLLRQATVIHCGVFKEQDGTLRKFYEDSLKEMCDYLDTVDVLVIHNGIGYDLPLLKKLFG